MRALNLLWKSGRYMYNGGKILEFDIGLPKVRDAFKDLHYTRMVLKHSAGVSMNITSKCLYISVVDSSIFTEKFFKLYLRVVGV